MYHPPAVFRKFLPKMTSKITLEQVSYANPKHRQVLNSCLKSWFANPRDLNLTDPRMNYPFDFRQWIKLAYSNDDTVTYVLKTNDWIIGYFSLLLPLGKRTATLFHVFIDRGHRGKRLGNTLLLHAEAEVAKYDYNRIRLKVLPKNSIALQLYESAGFIQTGATINKSLIFEKRISGDR